jgi:hypothetical protein
MQLLKDFLILTVDFFTMHVYHWTVLRTTGGTDTTVKETLL